MTENELRSKVANWLTQFIGISEGSSGHLSILNTFNNSGLCSRYKMTKNDYWCATSVSSSFIASGLAGKPGSGKLFECVECSCGNMVKLAQNQGIWVETDNYTPKVGDVVMYDWDDSGAGDDTGWPDHVGIVSSVNGNTFRVIEGNMNNTVGYRNMTVNGKYIRGFITPKYSKFVTVTEATKPVTPSPAKPSIKPSTSISSKTLNKTCKFKGVVVNVNTVLNVRSWAGTVGTKVVRTIKNGTRVEVCDVVKDKDGDDWYYIKESGKYGFVYSDYIARESVTKPTSTSKTLNKTCKFKGVVVNVNSALNVRSWAGTESDKLRTIAKGKVVDVCDEVKASTGKVWYYIKESGKYGFVCSDYIARK